MLMYALSGMSQAAGPPRVRTLALLARSRSRRRKPASRPTPRVMARWTEIWTRQKRNSAGAVPMTAASEPLAPTAAKNTCARVGLGFARARTALRGAARAAAGAARARARLQDDAGQALGAGHERPQRARRGRGERDRERGDDGDGRAGDAQRRRQLAARAAERHRDRQCARALQHLRAAGPSARPQARPRRARPWLGLGLAP